MEDGVASQKHWCSQVSMALPQQHHDSLAPDVIGQLDGKRAYQRLASMRKEETFNAHLSQSLSTSGRVRIEVENESYERERRFSQPRHSFSQREEAEVRTRIENSRL